MSCRVRKVVESAAHGQRQVSGVLSDAGAVRAPTGCSARDGCFKPGVLLADIQFPNHRSYAGRP